MINISLHAQAVLDAVKTAAYSRLTYQAFAAAALRAAVTHLAYSDVPDEFAGLRSPVIDADDLLAIAAELEALPDD